MEGFEVPLRLCASTTHEPRGTMDPDALFEPSTNPDNTARWSPLIEGVLVTASGAPGRPRFARWLEAGVTDVVTLQRDDERPDWLPDACAQEGVSWRAFPLSGKRLEHPDDVPHLRELMAWADALCAQPGGARRVVLHCSAGLHRTGIGLYLMMRRAGHAPDEAVARVARARPLTASELTRHTRRSGRLIERVEPLLT